MTDGDIVAMLLISAIGAFGGLVTAVVAALVLRTYRPQFWQAEPVDLQVTVQAQPVSVPIRFQVPPIEPITVPVKTAPPASADDLARRILAEYPVTGPSALARMLDCSKSTASVLIDRLGNGAVSGNGTGTAGDPARSG